MKRSKNQRPALAPGERWFELLDAFDPANAKRILPKLANRTFIRGKIGETMVVEIPKDATADVVQAIQRSLAAMGHDALIVTEGIRFLKVRVCSLTEGHDIESRMKEARDATSEEPT